ncbi:MAG: prepilin-type N-terminal cleavage/methylation domain-containing protein [Myxococcota bacterium]|nr:prepilin-type N-terminal cleavage/methylation domain-containing protein [Myxococcota bacterium]
MREGCAPSTARGFTLVELAIAITMIGILIGGILKGEELVNKARVTRTVKIIHETTAAVVTFRDKYGQFPGDMSTARTRLPGCDEQAHCMQGNGDGLIGQGPSVYSQSGASEWSTGILMSEAGVDHPKSLETTMSWKHLALADLIAGIDGGAHPLDDLAWGVTHPASPFVGGLHLQHGAGGRSAAAGMNGLSLVFRDDMTGMVGHGSFSPLDCGQQAIEAGNFFQFLACSIIPEGTAVAGEYVVTPAQTLEIDRKADDGNPASGFVRGFCVLGPAGMASASRDCFFWARLT